MITIKLILWLVIIAAFVYADWYQIVKKKSRPFYLLMYDMSMGIALHGDPLYVGRNSGWIDRFHYINNWTMLAYWILKFIAVVTIVGTTLNIYGHGA